MPQELFAHGKHDSYRQLRIDYQGDLFAQVGRARPVIRILKQFLELIEHHDPLPRIAREELRQAFAGQRAQLLFHGDQRIRRLPVAMIGHLQWHRMAGLQFGNDFRFEEGGLATPVPAKRSVVRPPKIRAFISTKSASRPNSLPYSGSV